MITIVNKHTHKPTVNDFYIGRGSPLGNPYTSMKTKTKAQFRCETREESVNQYEKYILEKVRIKDKQICDMLNKIYLAAKQKKDVYLVCFCAPKLCHGNVIKKIIEKKL